LERGFQRREEEIFEDLYRKGGEKTLYLKKGSILSIENSEILLEDPFTRGEITLNWKV